LETPYANEGRRNIFELKVTSGRMLIRAESNGSKDQPAISEMSEPFGLGKILGMWTMEFQASTGFFYNLRKKIFILKYTVTKLNGKTHLINHV